MKVLKYRNAALAGVLALMAASFSACDSDIDPVYVLPTDQSTLAGGTGEVVLSPDYPNALALTIYWSGDGRLALDNPDIQAPVNADEQTIQIATDENFTSPVEISVNKGVRQRQFLSEELNSLLGRIGVEAYTPTDVYIRVKSVLVANMEPAYSTVLKIKATTYRIILQLASVLDSGHNDTGRKLASPTENGVYAGFLSIPGWYNWFLLEANGVEWGNLGQDASTFKASSADDKWNFWYPDPTGCYYTTVNTVEGWWSALYISDLSVSGDVSGELVYNRATNQWTLPVTIANAGNISINISGNASLYDYTTTDMGPAISKTVAFGGSADALTFGENGSAITLTVPAGETNIVLDLNDPMAFQVKAGEAATEPEPTVGKYLYFSGLVEWPAPEDYDYITLYDEASQCYGGAHYINSEWGYRAYPDRAWDPAYKAADGATGLSGSLVLAESDGNIPGPEAGLYVMDFHMKDLTYQLTKIESLSFTGLNDDWSETPMTQSEENPEIWTGEFVKTANTPWGVKVLVNHDWSLFFGGGLGDGILKLGFSDATSGFEGDNDACEIGKTYLLNVNLGTQTYWYSEK